MQAGSAPALPAPGVPAGAAPTDVDKGPVSANDPAAAAAKLRSGSVLYKSTSYFDDEQQEAPAFYTYVLDIIKPWQLALGMAGLYTGVQIAVLGALGLGQTFANGLLYAIGCELSVYGMMQLLWREDVHWSALKPGTRSFYMIAVIHTLYDAAAYGYKEFLFDYDINSEDMENCTVGQPAGS